jgi:hypothetical protein
LGSKQLTYLKNITWNTRFWCKRILVTPSLRIEGLIEMTHLVLLHLNQPSNVILHDRSEARTIHSRVDQPALELSRQIYLVILPADTTRKQAEQLAGSLVHSSTLRNGDAVREAPRQLLQGADKALIRALGALLGERRLEQ